MTNATPNTPEDSATAWRDLRDQLTGEQIARFEELERDPNQLVRSTRNPRLRWTREALLESARLAASNNLAGAMYADMERPGGSVVVLGWESGTDSRYFRGTSWVIERNNRETDMCVDVVGTQYGDGRVERFVGLDDDDMSVEQARALAAALLEAADEIDRFAGNQTETPPV
jgi:hypothetical protein